MMRKYITPIAAALLVALVIAIPAESNIIWTILSGNLFIKNQGDQDAIYVGENDYGVDVTLYGATSGKYVMWDESADELIVAGTLDLNGTNVSATAAEINLIDGSVAGTSVASKALVLGTSRNTNYFAVDDTLLLNTALARVLSGSTVDFESGSAFKIAGTEVTYSAAEANLLDGSVAVTAVASKALALGATKNVDSLRVTYFEPTHVEGTTFHMGDLSGATTIALTDNYIPLQINLVSATNPASAYTLGGIYSKVANTTADQANTQLVGILSRVSMGKNATDAYGLQSQTTLVDGAESSGNMTAVSGKTILYDDNASGIVTAGLFTLEGQASDTHGAVPRKPTTAYGVWADIVDTDITAGFIVNANNSAVASGLTLAKMGSGTITKDITLQNGETIDNADNNVIKFSGKVIKFPLNAALPDTTGFEGGEMWLSAIGDTLYTYLADHTIKSQP